MRLLEVVLAVVCCLAVFISAIQILPTHYEQKYDCSLAEFHPDYPVRVKEECRKLPMENVK